MGRSLAAVVVWLLVTSVTAAETKPEYIDPLTNIGSTTRALGDEAVEIRVEINPRNATEGKAPLVQEVVQDGILKNAGMFTTALKPAAGGGAYLVIAPTGGASVKIGTYTIQIELPKLLKTPPEAGAPAAEDRPPQQVIKVTLTRGGQPKSAVVMPSPLKIERIIGLSGVSYEPKEWIMRETTGDAPLIPDPKETSAHLVSQTTSGLGMVNVTFPDRIEAAQEGKAQVALAGGPQCWIGNATATVLLRSATMAKPLTMYSVQVQSRYSYFWLFLTIIAGVISGIIVNRVLVPKIANMTARAKAASELARIVAIRDAFVDAEVAGDLNQVAAKLAAATNDQTLDGAAVIKAATFAAGEADRIAGAVRTLANDVTNRLNYLLDLVRHPEAQVGLMRDLARRTANRAEALHQALRAGHIHSTEEEMKQMERELPYEVAVVLPSWKQSIARPLAKMGRWPGLPVNTDLTSLAEDVAAVKEPTTLEEVGETLGTAEHIARKLGSTVGPRGFEEIHDLVREVIGTVASILAGRSELAALTKSEEALRAFDNAELPRQFDAGADAVADARLALDDALTAAWIPTGANATPPGLSNGEYPKVLQEIRAQSGGGPSAAASATHAVSPKNVKTSVAHAPAPRQFARPDLPADAVRPPEYYAGIAVAASWVRDLILGLFVVSGGMIIFMPAYIGTFPDFAAALLWGFSVNLGAETVTVYATPLLARRPFA